MRSKTTSNLAIHPIAGWRERLGCCQSRRLTPLGLILMFLMMLFLGSTNALADYSEDAANYTKTWDFGTNNPAMSEWTNYGWTRVGTSHQFSQTFSNSTNDMHMLQDLRFNGYIVLYDNGSGIYLTANQEASVSIPVESGNTVKVTGYVPSGTRGATWDNVSNTPESWGSTSTTVTAKAVSNGYITLTYNANRALYITKIEVIAKPYVYDPAVETYDLYYNTDNIQSNNLKPAGFNLDYDDYEAQYLTNLSSGLALNDRIAISQVEYNGYYTPWQIDHGFKSLYNWHNISITNLVEGDRVVITWIGNAKFSSKAEQMAYNGCAAFRDNGNDGDFTEGTDAEIALGKALEAKTTNWDNNANANIYTSYPYVVTEDGHLDIALSADSKIVKVVIYGDHQAQMVDRDNINGTTTSYFNTTGQLEAKQHIVPGGLNVYVGNTDNTQHAEVVSSDQGPVSFVYDQSHFKMARTASWGVVNVWQELPATGTYYKFVPEVSGKMWVKFKAASIKYRNYNIAGNNENIDGNGTPNEYTAAVNCPYYLMVEQNGSFQAVENAHYYSNGANGFFGHFKGDPTGDGDGYGIDVERGKTYYLYGWWQDGVNVSALQDYACGVAELIEVTFLPNQSVAPLAKWVESGTTSDGDLADVKGYTTVRVKKKSSNIASCEPYIEGGKLKIRNITFVDENKGGGTILIKIGDPNIDANPVFAYTIAYDAAYNPSEVGQDINGKTITRSEGHTWNFSDQPLKGLRWSNKNAEADEAIFGPYFNNFATADKDENGVPTNGVNNQCFLYEEMNKTNPDGTKHADWTFNYRVKKNSQFLDPRFLNNYDMEGDNADMMWDTEGIIINAGSTQSCIFDEFMLTNDRVIDHRNKTQADPDRYVGFLPGGSFIIPKLKKDDRVIVYMGSGAGSGATSMDLHITNARDAMYNEIDPTDNYHAGGSQWNVPNGHNDPYYRGCYHFFALADGDMKFEMAGGSMCKLYSIKIYRGARECTNGVQENSGGYILLAEKDQSGNVTSTETKSWTLHYRGKGEQVADGTGANEQANEVLASSGNIENTELGILRGGQSNARIGITYTNEGEIGMLRVRVKCMEFNQKYVTDFADRNLTLALHETKSYPYTWDFTDVNGFSSADIQGEYDNYNEITDLESTTTWYEPLGRELSMWDEDGNMVLKASTEEYANQNMIFENSKGIDGNQLYANGDVIPETKGLWFYFDNNDVAYNGSTQITADGLRLSNAKRELSNGGTTMGWWNTKMVVPAVPAGAAVYARVIRDNSVKMADDATGSDGVTTKFLWSRFQFITEKHTEKQDGKDVTIVDVGMPEKVDMADGIKDDNYYECRFYKVEDKTAYEANDGEDEYIIAILNKGTQGDLHLTFNGWIVEKLSVSLDPKAVNVKGWTTESRNRVIDPELTAFLTGYDFETCLVTGFDKDKRSVTLSRVYDPATPTSNSKVMRQLSDGQNGANIIHNKANGEVKILKGTIDGVQKDCFHLFVPDMHDYIANRTDGLTNLKSVTNGNISGKTKEVDGQTVDDGNYLVAQVSAATIGQYSTARPWFVNGSQTTMDCTNYTMSYRYFSENPDGTYDENQEMEGDEAFYRVAKGGAQSGANKAYLPLPTDYMMVNGHYTNIISFVYDGEETGIQDVTNYVSAPENNVYYTIDGQKLNGVPTIRGIYIVNGKKVVIK